MLMQTKYFAQMKPLNRLGLTAVMLLFSSINQSSRQPKKFEMVQMLSHQTTASPFLDTPSHLYMRLCPSVRRSVGPSVRPVLFSKVISKHTRGILCRVSGLVYLFDGWVIKHTSSSRMEEFCFENIWDWREKKIDVLFWQTGMDVI